MKEAFWASVEVDDSFSDSVLVTAIPPLGAMINLHNRGTFKVKEVEFAGTSSPNRNGSSPEPLAITLRCVPVLAF